MSAQIYNFETLLRTIVLTNINSFFPDTTFVPLSLNSYLAVIFLPCDTKTCGTKELTWCDVMMTYSTSKRLMTLLTTNMRLHSMAGSLSLPLAVKTIFTEKGCVLYRVSGISTVFHGTGTWWRGTKGQDFGGSENTSHCRSSHRT
jgi:hypothetical protein